MKKKLLLFLLIPVLLTGCIKRDSMEDITIYTSSYAVEYITNYLYGKHSDIKQIYPDGVIIDEYDLTDVQIEEYSNCDLFIYNGLSKEKEYVNKMKKFNRDLKMIDISYSIEYDNSTEKLYINPSNFLMITQNVKNGLEEYINNDYLKKEIIKYYDELKVNVSNLDAKIYLTVNQSEDNNLLIFDPSLNFLSKYGFNVYLYNEKTSDKDKETIESLINNGNVKYIYGLNNTEETELVSDLVKEYGLEILRLNDFTNLNEIDRKSNKDYISIMTNNIELLKQELNN